MVFRKEISLSPNKVITIETGRLARLASGSALVTMGETVVLATVVAKEDVVFQDFLPLQVEYREKFSAAGRFPGGFVKREGRPSEKEILSSRLIDRALRPLFPDGYVNDTQIVVSVLSSDNINDSDVLGGIAASTALMVSDIPFENAMGEVRVGRVNGDFIINPTKLELANSDLEICIAGTEDTICMLEGEMKEISEKEMLAAISFGHKYIQEICRVITEIQKCVAKPKKEFKPFLPERADLEFLQSLCFEAFSSIAKSSSTKQQYTDKIKSVYEAALKQALTKYEVEITPEIIEGDPFKELLINKTFLKSVIHSIERDAMRRALLSTNKRLDGRESSTLRQISIETSVLPRPHGSALFTRGETQALVSLTLGTKKDEQMVDTLFDEVGKRFMLHYNFPPFSVGEVGRMTGVGRREVGHGNLAERAIKMVLPDESDFPYTIRVVSDILESNGSSSMASVCGATLACMDGGIPIKKSVAGIAMGLVKEDDHYVILSDISGAEDHLGDMDFKVAGTKDGITACQMDIKINGLDYGILEQALEQARIGRLFILEKIHQVLPAPRADVSKYAPRLISINIKPESIGALIGKGGETIKALTALTKSEIDIDDKGKVTIATKIGSEKELAIKLIKAITSGEPEVNETYPAKIKEIRDDLGAIVEFTPGFPNGTGLVHFTEVGLKGNQVTSDVLKVGDSVVVKLVRISEDKRTGRLKFSYSLKI